MEAETPFRTILLVEDDPNDRLIVEHAFARVSPEIRLRMTTDGEEAVAYLRGDGSYADREAHPLPVVILLDLKLPKKSGLEVLEWIREQPDLSEIPVLILSSSQERGDIDLAYALGANSYLVKQVEIGTLRKLVQGIVAYSALVPPLPSATG